MDVQNDQCEEPQEREASERFGHRRLLIARQRPCRSVWGVLVLPNGPVEAQACQIKYAAPWLARGWRVPTLRCKRSGRNSPSVAGKARHASRVGLRRRPIGRTITETGGHWFDRDRRIPAH